MAATYDETLIATSLRDRLRLRFRDIGGLSGTTVTKPLLNDEAYDGLLDAYSANPREGAAQIALTLAAVFAQRVQSYAKSGDIDVVWPKRPEFYERQALDLRKYGVEDTGAGGSYAGVPDLPSYTDDERIELA
jgi:hypothetical protein